MIKSKKAKTSVIHRTITNHLATVQDFQLRTSKKQQVRARTAINKHEFLHQLRFRHLPSNESGFVNLTQDLQERLRTTFVIYLEVQLKQLAKQRTVQMFTNGCWNINFRFNSITLRHNVSIKPFLGTMNSLEHIKTTRTVQQLPQIILPVLTLPLEIDPVY